MNYGPIPENSTKAYVDLLFYKQPYRIPSHCGWCTCVRNRGNGACTKSAFFTLKKSGRFVYKCMPDATVDIRKFATDLIRFHIKVVHFEPKTWVLRGFTVKEIISHWASYICAMHHNAGEYGKQLWLRPQALNPFSAKDELTRSGPWKWQNDVKSRN